MNVLIDGDISDRLTRLECLRLASNRVSLSHGDYANAVVEIATQLEQYVVSGATAAPRKRTTRPKKAEPATEKTGD